MLSSIELAKWQELMNDLAGLYISSDKAYLFETRLNPLMRSKGCDMAYLYQQVKAEPAGTLSEHVVELMTTHETHFFRDQKPFVMFSALLEELVRARRLSSKRLITVFSAGCSTGEEPYSIAITCQELLHRHPAFRYSIYACDIAGATLEMAREGYFQKLNGLAPDHIARYFSKRDNGWVINAQLQRHIRFERRNILNLENMQNSYDFIFCRNVAIYFEKEIRQRLFEALGACINPGGALILGASESLGKSVAGLKRKQHPAGFYYVLASEKPVMA